MHKKLASDLTSLAHSILKMKKKDDVFELKQKAYEVYEKLSVLAYVEEYINNTPNPTKTKAALLADVLLAEENRIVKDKVEVPLPEENKVVHYLKEEEFVEEELVSEKVIEPEEIVEVKEIVEVEETVIVEDTDTVEKEVAIEEKDVNEILEQPFDELEDILFKDTSNIKNDVEDVGERKTQTLEEELQDTISVDVMADLFKKADSKSLNDRLQNTIQIGLNDRIAFVKHLFDNNQNDFNRVISQLNTLKTEKEARSFINKMVKPDYDWSDKEAYENRLFEIIERRFA
ncbi:hypothetical protein PG911_01375 [Tenacibaculum ovolyticum]|uniref:hypothetical protein n=1 Tax=Tenacibaculum ovolyticum TaxID=104270 RepID=UPI0003FC3080|nr:hypothetical protein [Tenacibaculum ovolyticum]WBX76938.1 hypothetical protein PG911_01375 [Tenacibaculum ovolyticum]